MHLADVFPSKAHDIEVGVNLDIDVLPQPVEMNLRKKPGGLVSVFELSIDSAALGLTDLPSGSEAEASMRGLVLALNVVSSRGVFALSRQELANLQIVHEPRDEKVSVQRDAAGDIIVRATAGARLSVHAGVSIASRLEIVEPEVLSVYERVRGVRVSTDHEWLEALDRFEEGTTSMNRLTAVQKYAMATEKVANMGRGTDLKGADLDIEVARMSGKSVKTAEHIRLLFNKTKHSVGRPADQKFLLAALQNLSQTAQDAKQMAANVIQARLPL